MTTAINIKTGEVVAQDAPLAIRSDALKVVSEKIKQLQEIEKQLKEFVQEDIEKAVEMGEDKLADYWDIRRGRMTFDSERFKEKASKELQREYKDLKRRIKNIENGYLKIGKSFIQHPKF